MIIETRRAQPSDAEAIVPLSGEVQALHAQQLPELFKPPTARSFPAAAVRELFDEQDRIILVACVDATVVGYASAYLERRAETPFRHAATSLCIQWMGVRADWRRRGVGRSLIHAMGHAAVENGATSLLLDVWAANEDACAFYEALGFRSQRHILSMGVTKTQ